MILPHEKQVASLELSQQLKAAGFPQETLWYWWATEIEEDGLTWWSLDTKEPRKGKRIRKELGKDKVAAPTVAELGMILLFDTPTMYSCGYKNNLPCLWLNPRISDGRDGRSIIAKTEADDRALMWLWLKKEGKV